LSYIIFNTHKKSIKLMKSKIKFFLVYLIKILGFAVLYHLAARLGLKMAYVQANTSPVWPPTGIAIAVLILFGPSLWPGITLGVLVGSVLTGAPVSLAIGMAAGNTLEAVIAVYFLKRILHFHDALDRLNDVIGLAVVALVTTAISATIGTSTLNLATETPRSAFFDIWITWWIGDLLGALVVAPFILVWLKRFSLTKIRKSIVESIGLILLIMFISWYVFSKTPPIDVAHQAMIYVIFPFIIWAALRFGQHGATTGIVLISAIAIWGSVNGTGPFAQESINESLILLQTFMGVVSLTSLILAATTIERRKAAQALQQRIEDLDTLNKASKSFLGNFDKDSVYHIICKIAVEKFNITGAWIEMQSAENLPNAVTSAYGIEKKEIMKQMEVWKDKRDIKDKEVALFQSNNTLPEYKSFGVFPLIFGNRTLGALNLLSNSTIVFSEDKQLLIQSYANLAAVAIQNAWLFEEVSHGNEQLHALSQRLMKAQEEERLHLSRELHDESGQLLAAMMVELGLLSREAEKNIKITDHLKKIEGFSHNLQNNLHRLAVNLRPASLDHLGLVTALEQYIQEFSRQHSIEVDFEAVGLEKKRLPIEIETSLFRIVQESLTNIAIHAEAAHVDVLISYRNQHVVTVVEDDGVGFIPTGPTIEKQLGLFGMKERVEMMQGSFTIESAPGKGTTIKVEVPIGD
jgi:signal transduction histidine kinase